MVTKSKGIVASRTNRGRWHSTEIGRMFAMRGETPPRKWREVADSLGRSTKACELQMHLELKRRAARNEGFAPPARAKSHNRVLRRTRAEMLSDGKRQVAPDPRAPIPQHTSLTAAAFGDPLPGRSALDLKMREGSSS